MRVVWGPIEFQRSRSVSAVWTRATQYKDYHRNTSEAAAALLREIVFERIKEGYSKLPKGCRITPKERASGVSKRS